LAGFVCPVFFCHIGEKNKKIFLMYKVFLVVPTFFNRIKAEKVVYLCPKWVKFFYFFTLSEWKSKAIL